MGEPLLGHPIERKIRRNIIYLTARKNNIIIKNRNIISFKADIKYLLNVLSRLDSC